MYDLAFISKSDDISCVLMQSTTQEDGSAILVALALGDCPE